MMSEADKAAYDKLPVRTADMVIRCPTTEPDGSPCQSIPGCGSCNVLLSDDGMYDCCDCGIFFEDYAADPPHRLGSSYDNHRPGTG